MILADDGSKPEIEEIFRRFSREALFSTAFLRQEDRGWGKPRMLNWSVLEAKADVICFTDADCVPHRHFVRSHLEEAGENRVLCGRRVDLMEKIAPEISREHVRTGQLESPLWLLGRIFKGEADYGEQGFYISRLPFRIARAFSRKPTLLGSNFSVRKQSLLDLNGFDESFTVPGIGEDTDMQRRFEMAGLKLRWITHRAIQYHLWHPLTPVGRQAHDIFESLKSGGNQRALKGIQEFLPEWEAAGL